MRCPHCGSTHIVRNGTVPRFYERKKYRLQRYLCMDCGRTRTDRRTEETKGA